MLYTVYMHVVEQVGCIHHMEIRFLNGMPTKSIKSHSNLRIRIVPEQRLSFDEVEVGR